MSLLLLFGEPTAVTESRDGRASFEALEAFASSAINYRESVEALFNTSVPGLDGRSSFEALWQIGTDYALDSRLSIEILEGPILSTESWGPLPM